MIHAALQGQLDSVPTRKDPVFGFDVPTGVHGVPTEVLDPRGTWKDPARYDEQARKIADMFRRNFAQFADGVDDGIRRAGPTA
jgi:phosphoenolpyruvate carboxykinase (ATP)